MINTSIQENIHHYPGRLGRSHVLGFIPRSYRCPYSLVAGRIRNDISWKAQSSIKLAIILSTKLPETNWNALRLANLALAKGDTVTIFLTGEGVEYEQHTSSRFNIQKQVEAFLRSARATIVACGTCMAIRKQGSSQECQAGGIEDAYNLIAESDKVITF